MVVNALYNMVDQIFIGWGVGYLGNGATNIVFPIVVVCLAFSLMFGDGTSAYLSLRLGEKKQKVLEINVTNLTEPQKAKLRGAIKFFSGDNNNIPVKITANTAINKILNPYSDHLQNSSAYDDYEISEFGIIEHWLRNDKKTPVSQLYKE